MRDSEIGRRLRRKFGQEVDTFRERCAQTLRELEAEYDQIEQTFGVPPGALGGFEGLLPSKVTVPPTKSPRKRRRRPKPASRRTKKARAGARKGTTRRSTAQKKMSVSALTRELVLGAPRSGITVGQIRSSLRRMGVSRKRLEGNAMLTALSKMVNVDGTAERTKPGTYRPVK